MNLRLSLVTDARKDAAGAHAEATHESRDDIFAARRSSRLFVLAGMVNQGFAAPQEEQANGAPLKQLSLAELGNVEVTTASKEPEKISKISAAIFVLTQDDIRRSGATSIPEVLRLVPEWR